MDEERENKAVAHAKKMLKLYEEIGVAGNWGKAMIIQDLDRYQRAKEAGYDVEALVVELEGIK